MKIVFIGARGYPVSYASAEDMVRELGPRFVRAGHEFAVHGWATEESIASRTKHDCFGGVRRVFHRTPGGKISGQFVVALRASISAAFSDCDVVHYQCLNSAVFCWIPRIAGKCVVVNVNGQVWKDPKWPWGIRHLYFHLSAVMSLLFASRVITDSSNMSAYYRRVYGVHLPHIAYGCREAREGSVHRFAVGPPSGNGYYVVMSRITPHNLTDVIVDGFLRSGSRSELLIAGHLPSTPFVRDLRARAEGTRVRFLGLVEDQRQLDDLLFGCRAYLHGHSLGGINSALVRVVGLGRPVIAVDTPFNREVVEEPNRVLQAVLFEKDAGSVAHAITAFELNESEYSRQAHELGLRVRDLMSWDAIFEQYHSLYMNAVTRCPVR